MNILNGNDLINLPIFQCRACSKRLQYPIMEIEQFGNVCGGCSEGVPYANANRNEALCLLMEKLRFPCNYKEDGCTFFGPFRKTCQHQQRCIMRNGLCPFTYNDNCDALLCMIDIVTHINEKHKGDISTVEAGYVTVENPSNADAEIIRAFKIGENWFLIRSLREKGTDKILYTFYRFGDNAAAENTKFYSDAFNEEPGKYRVMHLFELKYKFDVGNAFSANLSRLESLNFGEKIKISIQNYAISKSIDMERAWKAWFQCQKCLNIFKRLRFCTTCRVNVLYCGTCEKKCLECNDSANVCEINLSDVGVSYAFICQSEGCNQVLPGDVYGSHKTLQCRFKSHECLFCDKEYTIENMADHIVAAHQPVVNPNMCSIVQLDAITSYAFVNDVNVFILKSWVSSNKMFHVSFIKLLEPCWDNSYVWKIHLESEENRLEVFIAGDFSMSRFRKKINVSEFMVRDNLKFTVHITRI